MVNYIVIPVVQYFDVVVVVVVVVANFLVAVVRAALAVSLFLLVFS